MADTHTDPDTLSIRYPAGRELDYLVAERVLHLAVERSNYHDGYNCSYPLVGGGRMVLAVPACSTDMGAAWATWEARWGTYTRSLQFVWHAEDSFWAADIKTGDDTYVTAFAPTAPHAICLVLLLASGWVPTEHDTRYG